MELEQLEILERKINQAVNFIEKMKLENQTLKDEVVELRSQSKSKDEIINQLKEENHNLKLMQSEASLGKEKEEQIRSRVEQMLSKLDELEYLNT